MEIKILYEASVFPVHSLAYANAGANTGSPLRGARVTTVVCLTTTRSRGRAERNRRRRRSVTSNENKAVRVPGTIVKSNGVSGDINGRFLGNAR